jgi:uncharacterized protein YjiS (DUF1127 family)
MIFLTEELTEAFQGFFDKFRLQRKAEHELMKLSKEELEDLDLQRHEIYGVVYEATQNYK